MTSNLITVLAALAIICILLGFAAGRISTAPKPKVPFHLSDAAIAHIAHEAKRAYQRSLGIIRLKAWNNLEPAHREQLTRRVEARRKGTVHIVGTSFESRIEAAILALSAGR